MAAPSNVLSAVRRLPVVVILGATGTGKSKLAIEIGRIFNGEIISADAMQLYQGLDIITNKVTTEEQEMCLHHMIGYVNPHSFYTVTDFRNKAVPLIDGLLQSNKLPIIVGGTNYYIEALLWNILISEEKETDTLVWEEHPVSRLKIRRRMRKPEQAQLPICSNTSDAPLLGGCMNHVNTNEKSDHLKYKDVSRSLTSQTGYPDVGGDGKEVRHTANASSGHGVEAISESGDIRTWIDSKQEAKIATDVKPPYSSQIKSTLLQDIEQKCSKDELHFAQPECEQLTVKHSAIDGTPSSSRERGTTADEFHDEPSRDGLGQYEEKRGSRTDHGASKEPVQYEEIDVEMTDSATLHQLLADVDPERANGLHPNDRRKIIRSLQVYEQQGIPHSAVLARQHQQTGASCLSGPLRYPNLCILWIQSDMEVLRQRLDARVDDMIARGLVEELADFHRQHNQQRLETLDSNKDEQYVNGIFQSIGFKEFHDYLILSNDEKNTEEGSKLLSEGVERMKIATRQYARKQNKWVRNRFIKRPGPAVPPVYSLDSTDPSKWNELVRQPALDILKNILQGRTPSVEPVRREQFTEGNVDGNQNATFVCDVCQGKLVVGLPQWEAHLKSRTHTKRKRKAVIRKWKNQQKQKAASAADEEEKALLT